MKTIILSIFLLAPLAAFAQRVHITSRAGDTVLPGSPDWIHAGSPHNSTTGEELTLIWGTDGKLHSLGYAIEDSDGAWVASTPENRKIVEDHLETKRLIAAVKEIMRESPDRKITKHEDSNVYPISETTKGNDGRLAPFHRDTSALARRAAIVDSLVRIDGPNEYWDERERQLELRPNRAATWWGWRDEIDYSA